MMPPAKRNLFSQLAFTLIEMLVVMAIVALLISIALPRYFNSLERSKETVLQEDLKVMRLSIDQFYADKGRYPNTLDELVENKYLRTIPADPITESASTWILIAPANAKLGAISDIKSGAPGSDSQGRPYESL